MSLITENAINAKNPDPISQCDSRACMKMSGEHYCEPSQYLVGSIPTCKFPDKRS